MARLGDLWWVLVIGSLAGTMCSDGKQRVEEERGKGRGVGNLPSSSSILAQLLARERCVYQLFPLCHLLAKHCDQVCRSPMAQHGVELPAWLQEALLVQSGGLKPLHWCCSLAPP